MKKEALRVTTTIPVAPTTLYLAWLSSEQHSAMTGSPAKLEPSVGSKFTAWNGYITGKLIVLDLGRRILMSWRTTDFPRDATDSRVEVHFEAIGGSTRVTILHTDIPEGQGEKYRLGWEEHYFAPMRSFFSKYLPDPRQPPPPRRPPPPPEDEGEEEETAAKTKGKPLPKPSKPAAVAKGPPGKAPKPAAAKAAPPPKSAKPAAKPAAVKAPAVKKATKPPPAKKPTTAPAKKAAAKPAAKKTAPKPAAKKPAKKKR